MQIVVVLVSLFIIYITHVRTYPEPYQDTLNDRPRRRIEPSIPHPRNDLNLSIQAIAVSASSVKPKYRPRDESWPAKTARLVRKAQIASQSLDKTGMDQSPPGSSLIARATNNDELAAAIAADAPLFPIQPTPVGGQFPEFEDFDSLLWSMDVGERWLDGYSTTNLQLKIHNIENQMVVFLFGDGLNGYKFVTGVKFPITNSRLLEGAVQEARATGQIQSIFVVRPDPMPRIHNLRYFTIIQELSDVLPPLSNLTTMKYPASRSQPGSTYRSVREFTMGVRRNGGMVEKIFDFSRGVFVNGTLPGSTGVATADVATATG